MKNFELELKQLLKDWKVINEFIINPRPSSKLKQLYKTGDLRIFVWTPPKNCGKDGLTELTVDTQTGKKSIKIYINVCVLQSK